MWQAPCKFPARRRRPHLAHRCTFMNCFRAHYAGMKSEVREASRRSLGSRWQPPPTPPARRLWGRIHPTPQQSPFFPFLLAGCVEAGCLLSQQTPTLCEAERPDVQGITHPEMWPHSPSSPLGARPGLRPCALAEAPLPRMAPPRRRRPAGSPF